MAASEPAAQAGFQMLVFGGTSTLSKKRPAGGRPEVLSRNVAISSIRTTVRLHAVHRRGDEPEIESQPWLELSGKVSEPVRTVTDIRISMYPQEPVQVRTTRPASVSTKVQPWKRRVDLAL